MRSPSSVVATRILYSPRIPADLVGRVRVESFERHAFLWCLGCPACVHCTPKYEQSDWAAMRFHLRAIHGPRP